MQTLSTPARSGNTSPISRTFTGIIVQPHPDFLPTDWRQTPRFYKVVEIVGDLKFKGRRDAFLFKENHQHQNSNNIKRWAIALK